jgi:hypothetical protein
MPLKCAGSFSHSVTPVISDDNTKQNLQAMKNMVTASILSKFSSGELSNLLFQCSIMLNSKKRQKYVGMHLPLVRFPE